MKTNLSIYRKPASLPSVIKVFSAEDANRMAKEAQAKEFEQNQKAPLQVEKIAKEANKWFPVILKAIQAEAKQGKTSLFWSPEFKLFFKDRIYFPVANQLQCMLREQKFKVNLSKSCDGEYYYIGIDWQNV